jgi:hypothetical protein
MSANASVLSAPISFAIEFVQGHLFFSSQTSVELLTFFRFVAGNIRRRIASNNVVSIRGGYYRFCIITIVPQLFCQTIVPELSILKPKKSPRPLEFSLFPRDIRMR